MALSRQKKIEVIGDYARQLIEARRNGARGVPDKGFSAEFLYQQSKNTDLKLSRKTVQELYKQELKNFRSNKFSPSINYEKLPESKHRIIKKYSFVVQRGYIIDENGKYVRDKNGKKIGNYVTIATDEQLSRAQIKKKAQDIPPSSDCSSLGYSIRPHIVIKRMIRNIV